MDRKHLQFTQCSLWALKVMEAMCSKLAVSSTKEQVRDLMLVNVCVQISVDEFLLKIYVQYV